MDGVFHQGYNLRPTQFAHLIWKEHLLSLGTKAPCIIDATCGNGHDSLFLTTFGGTLHCIDIQKEAIISTKKRLENANSKVIYHHGSHKDLSFIEEKADLIVYNLGYLPNGDKTLITHPDTTIKSLESSLRSLSDKGLISIMIYTGHEGGRLEKEAISAFISALPRSYSVSHTTYPNKDLCPEVVTISS